MMAVNTTELVIPIQANLKSLLQAIGTPETIVFQALRRYLLEICWQRLESAEQQVAMYEERYKLDYAIFYQKVTQDELFLTELEGRYPMWEADALEWHYRLEERELWQQRLGSSANIYSVPK